MFKKIGNTFKKGFKKVGNFFKGIFNVMATPFKKLTWPKRIFKLLGIGVLVFLFVGVVLTVIVFVATAIFVGGFIFSLGGAIEHGTNEMFGRNRRRRDYY